MVRGTSDGEAGRPRRADAQRNRVAILDAAAELLRRDGAGASLEEIARRAGVGSATLHRHFRGHQALVEAVYDTRVEQLCAEADVTGQRCPDGDALWVWLRHIAHHCVAERALAALLRNEFGDTTSDNRSLRWLCRAGQPLLDRAAAAGTVRSGVTLEELLLLVNAVAEVCSNNGADVDRLLELTWNGAR